MKAAAVTWVVAVLVSISAAQADVVGERRQLEAAYRQALDDLATWCDQQKLAEQAKLARSWALPSDPLSIVIPEIAPAVDAPPGADAPTPQTQWHEKFWQLRRKQADALFELARKAVTEHRATLAFELVRCAARENPDHEAAQKILGHVKHDGRWLTPFEIDKASSRQVWDARFGWLPRDRLPRYERGERFNRGQWVSAEQDARLSREIAQGWNVVTEHYSVRTNVGLEDGVRLAVELERLDRAWRQLFVLYYAPEDEVARWLRGNARRAGLKQIFQVTSYKTRDEYIAALVKAVPNIGISTGYYDPRDRRAYFFGGVGEDNTHLYHEATHQLFAEVRTSKAPPGDVANFWIVEGVACYLESYTPHAGYATVGGANAQRLLNAEHRLLTEGFYVPLAELVTFGRERLQADERIGKLYAQAAGMTHFLMHYDGGRYRDALVDYLISIYTGRDTPQTLRELTGVDYRELDSQYREFLESLKGK